MAVESSLILATLVLYASASILAIVSFHRSVKLRDPWVLKLLVPAVIALAASLGIHGLRTGHFPVYTLFEVLAFYSLAISTFYLYYAFRYDTRSMSVIVLPYLTILLAAGAVHSGAIAKIDPRVYSLWLNIHILTALTGYALFTLASVFGLTYLLQDRTLKQKRLGLAFHKFPPLETLDRLMHGQIIFAFLVFTLSIGLGIYLTHLNRWGTQWLTDPKTLATGLTWLVYAVLFYLRLSAGEHGKKVAIIAVLGFCFVLITFFGVNFFTHSLHNLNPQRLAGGAG